MNGYELIFTDQDISTTSLTPVDVPRMHFFMPDNSIWNFKFVLKVGSSTNAGLKVALVVPPGALFQAWAIGSSNTLSSIALDSMTVSGTLGAAFATINAQGLYLSIEGSILNGATPGIVQLQAAKVTSGVATLNARSYLRTWPAR